ncbi:hypothetical protein AVEN_137681-1, partial [Araneus ventricosus]
SERRGGGGSHSLALVRNVLGISFSVLSCRVVLLSHLVGLPVCSRGLGKDLVVPYATSSRYEIGIVWYVDYEDEETDCSSDIFEVDLNLVTYKPSTSNRLIFLTDPKHKQLTPFISKSSQMRLGLPSTAVVGDRFGVSDRAVAAIASSVLHDVGPITSNNSDLVVDNNKLRTEKASSFKL